MTDRKARPILFSPAMAHALVRNRKTQTRRLIKPKMIPLVEEVIKVNGKWVFDTMEYELTTPYGRPEDLLWVRESWAVDAPIEQVRAELEDALGRSGTFGHGPYYKADIIHKDSGLTWRNGMFMPRWASRTTLEVTKVRAERIQDISHDDAAAEGLACLTKDGGTTYKYGLPDGDGLPGTDDFGWEWKDWHVSSRQAYKKIWEKINGVGNWEQNPWVWAIEFKVHQKNVDDRLFELSYC